MVEKFDFKEVAKSFKEEPLFWVGLAVAFFGIANLVIPWIVTVALLVVGVFLMTYGFMLPRLKKKAVA